MGVKIVTDSTSDISPEVADELGIVVVPSYVRFGAELYRDGIDIGDIELYDKLAKAEVHPTTSEPTPADFANVYSDCSKEAESIISIHISAKISRIYDSANQGKSIAGGTLRIGVLDSSLVSVGVALVVMFAARLAKAGEGFEDIIEKTQQTIKQIRMLAVFDTMRGLVFSDRVGFGITALADVANAKPLLTVKDGVLIRAGLARSYPEGVLKLIEFVDDNLPNAQDLAIAHSVVPERAHELKERFSNAFAEDSIYVTQLGAALGVHSGPRALVVALRRNN